jgi:hypothetical protein
VNDGTTTEKKAMMITAPSSSAAAAAFGRLHVININNEHRER